MAPSRPVDSPPLGGSPDAEHGSALRAAAAALLLPLAVSALVLAPSLGPGRVLLPKHTDELRPWRSEVAAERLKALGEESLEGLNDALYQFLPYRVHAERARAAGEEPGWFPDVAGGIPLHAMGLGAFEWPLAPGGGPAGLAPHALFCLALAGGGAALLALALGAAPLAAGIAGTVFALCGWMTARIHYTPVLASAAWLPIFLLAVHRISSGGRRIWIPVAAVAIGAAALSGFPSALVWFALASLAWAPWNLAALFRNDRTAALKATACLAAAGLLGLALAAPQLLASLAYSESWARRPGDLDDLTLRSLSPLHSLQLMLPDLFGHPGLRKAPSGLGTLTAFPAALLGGDAVTRSVVEHRIGVGLVAGLLALAACVRRPPRRETSLVALGAAVAFGLPPLLALLAQMMPGFDMGPPARAWILASLGLSLLAARGATALARGLAFPRLAMGAASLGGLAILAWAVSGLGEPAATGRAVFGPLQPFLADLWGVTGDEVAAVAADPALDGRFAAELGLLRKGLLHLGAAALAGAACLALAPAMRRRGTTLIALTVALELGLAAAPFGRGVTEDGLLREPALVQRLRDAAGAEDGEWRIARFGAGSSDLLHPNMASLYGIRDAMGYVVAPEAFEAAWEEAAPGTRTYGAGVLPPDDEAVLTHPIYDTFRVRVLLSGRRLDDPPPGWTFVERTPSGVFLYRNDDLSGAPWPQASGEDEARRRGRRWALAGLAVCTALCVRRRAQSVNR